MPVIREQKYFFYNIYEIRILLFNGTLRSQKLKKKFYFLQILQLSTELNYIPRI